MNFSFSYMPCPLLLQFNHSKSSWSGRFPGKVSRKPWSWSILPTGPSLGQVSSLSLATLIGRSVSIDAVDLCTECVVAKSGWTEACMKTRLSYPTLLLYYLPLRSWSFPLSPKPFPWPQGALFSRGYWKAKQFYVPSIATKPKRKTWAILLKSSVR